MNCNNTEIQLTVIQRIKNLRVSNGISQPMLAAIMNVSNGLVGCVESPRFRQKYSLKQIDRFCQYINYPFEQIFLTEEEIQQPDYAKLLIRRIIAYEE